jgi:hypothetical protein
MPADIRALLTEKTPEALRRLWELTGGEDKRLALMALVRWLEYSLGKPTQAIELTDPQRLALLETGTDGLSACGHLSSVRLRRKTSNVTAAGSKGLVETPHPARYLRLERRCQYVVQNQLAD